MLDGISLACPLKIILGKWTFGSGLLAPFAGTLVWTSIPTTNVGASVLSKVFVSAHLSVSAEPVQNLSVEISTETADELKSAPTSDPQSVNPQPIIDEEFLVPDEEERERCVREAREQDEAREWEQEFYDDGYQHD